MFTGSPRTQQTQKCLYNKWIKTRFNKNITEQELNEAIQEWSRIGLKANTIRSLVSLARKHHQWNTGYPMKTFSKINIPTGKYQEAVKALTQIEARKLLISIQKNQNSNVFMTCCLGYHAGLRKGEVFGLTWEDVDFFKNCLIIRRSYNGPTKNRKSRIVPMADYLYKLLISYSMGLEDKTRKLTRVFNPGPILKEECKKVGIPEITFHGLRHTFATLALDSGKSIKEVQEILGHSKASTTIDIYWNHLKSDMKVDFT